MSVQIIVDSTVDMPERMKDRFCIVPLTVHFGAEEFIDGVTIDKHRFYERPPIARPTALPRSVRRSGLL